MQRSLSMPLLFATACLASGSYGMLHNQISYSVSPEYFTKYKFLQFHIDPSMPDRWGAAVVGWEASWWMGIVLGVFLLPAGFLLRGDREYFWGMLYVFGIVLMTAMVFSTLGLTIAYLTVSSDLSAQYAINGKTIVDPVGFLRAGTMHNFSYLGGLVGLITGGVSILRRFLRAESGRN